MWKVPSIILATGLSMWVGMFVLGYFFIAIAGALAVGFGLSVVYLITGQAGGRSSRRSNK
jgi:hypothetical protein